MIIPIRCFTCNKVLADKWNFYMKEAEKIDESERQKRKQHNMFVYGSGENDKNDKKDKNDKNDKTDETTDKKYKNIDGAYKKEVLDKLGLNKLCCRRHMLGHVDMMDKI